MVGFNYKYDSNNNVLVAEKLHDPGNSEVYTYQSDGQLASFERVGAGVRGGSGERVSGTVFTGRLAKNLLLTAGPATKI